MRYPGGKGKSFAHVINLIPPHSVYIETHLGGGAVLRNMKPARRSLAIDIDPDVIANWRSEYPGLAEYRVGDAVEVLASYPFTGEELVYSDPPYVPSTRRRRRVYRHDYNELDHRRLLLALRALPCRVIVSGYFSGLYESELAGWNTHSFPAKAHDGMRQEWLWFNYPVPQELHDVRFLGATFREREIVRRRLERIKRRILKLCPQERHSLSDWLACESRSTQA